MALWGNVDNAANSTIFALAQVNKNTANSTERTNLFNNTTANDYFVGATVGQFAIDTTEQQQSQASSTERPTHSGWVLRTLGSGGRAGRVFYETLVAMGSMTGDSSNTILPQQAIVISSQPSNQTANSTLSEHAYFTVVASLVPTGGSIGYQWQYDNSGVMTNLSNDSTYANVTSAILDVKDVGTAGDGEKYRCVLTKAGATTVVTSNATLTVVT